MDLPMCGIRIYRNDGEYFDATLSQKEGGMVVVNKAENRPGSATFTLVNPSDSMSYVSPAFDGWSDDVASPVTPGMFVELRNMVSDTDGDIIMTGYISTIQPSEDSVSFEIGDGLAFLGKTGSWLRRNYRDEDTEPVEMIYDADPVDGTGYTVVLTPPEGLEETATPSAVYRYLTTTVDTTKADNTHATYSNPATGGYALCRAINFNLTRTVAIIGDDNVNRVKSTFTYNVTVTAGGRTFVTTSFVRQETGAVSQKSDTATVFVRGQINPSETVSITIVPTVTVTDYGSNFVTYVSRFDSATMDADKMERAEQYVSGNVFTDTSYTPSDLKSRVLAVYEAVPISIPTIMGRIAEAIGFDEDDIIIDASTPRKALAYYRVGGAYALDYLQKLADQRTADDRCVSFTVSNDDTRKLYIGRRYNVSDDAVYLLKYGGDDLPEGLDIPVLDISEFAPKLTLKNRPNLVTLNATLSDNSTLSIVLEDPSSTDNRGGLTIESLRTDSKVTDVKGAINSAYGELSASALDEWEGTVTVPGIVVGMMSETDNAHAGSGVPVEIMDSRYGFVDDSAHGLTTLHSKVKQVTYDFNRCVTILTIGNFDAQYSSGIADTNALVVGVRDMVTGISDTTLYDLQFAYVKDVSKSWRGDDTSTFVAHATNGSTFSMIGKVVEIPADSEGVGYTIVSATATASNEGGYLPSSVKYGIDKIILTTGTSSVTVDIPETRRPDFFSGQNLTICVMVRTP